MDNFITSAVNGIDKLLTVVNSAKKLLFLTCLMSLTGVSFLSYKLIQNQELLNEVLAPKIERVGGRWCYQQRRGGLSSSRFIGIQFPVSNELARKGVEQDLTGFIVNKKPSLAEFNELCNDLVQEVLSIERQEFLLQHYPESKQKLYDYYKNLQVDSAKQAAAIGAKKG